MHIKRIEIDGFKSYAQKMNIEDFDPEFNAITGLNGSGKSNILDAICFVLGITDLKCIRAENMNALVYKSGQAGITKASVTITFDNSDKLNCPIGYERCNEIIIKRQVVVNGRTNYTLNGSAMTNGKISDFFRAVGLNVNNPHFLIMQGRITKVLNMKPHEILGMVEEAAGTKMYDSKRAHSVGIIDKKQHKFNEIQNLLCNEIEPKVIRLRQEKQEFMSFQKLSRDIDILKKQLDAYEYWQYLQEEERLLNNCEEIGAEIRSRETRVEELKIEEQASIKRAAEIEATKTSKFNNERAVLTQTLDVVREARMQAESDRDSVAQSLTENQVEIDRIIEDKAKEEANLEETSRKLEEGTKSHGNEEDIGKKLEQEIATAKAKIDALSKGLSTDEDGQAITLEAQITNTKSALTDVSTQVKTAELNKAKIEPELEKKRREYNQLIKQSDSDTAELRQCEEASKKCQAALEKFNFDEATYEQKLNEKAEIDARIRQLKQQQAVQIQRSQSHLLELNLYNEKTWQGFDELEEIHGPFCGLIKLKDLKFALALETAAGNYNYQFVMSKQKTCARLVDEHIMLYRRTLLPLDKHAGQHYHSIPERLNVAKKIARDKGLEVHYALDVIEYDKQYESIMKSVFGGTLLCEDARFASELAFHKNISLKTVTYEGDVMQPGGTLSGGRPLNARAPIYLSLEGFAERLAEIRKLSFQAKQLEKDIAQMEGRYQEYSVLLANSKQAQGRLSALKAGMENSPLQILKDEIAQKEKILPECIQTIKDCQERMKELQAKIKELEGRKKNEKEYLDKEKKKTEAALKTAQQSLKNHKAKFENARDTLDRLRKEKQKVQATIQQLNDEIKLNQNKKEELSKELTEKEEDVVVKQATENEHQRKMDQFNAEIRAKDNEIKKARAQEEKIKKKIKELETESNNMKKEQTKAREDAKACKELALKLKKNCKTISDIESSLGKEGDYSFKNFDKKKTTAQLEKLKQDKETIGRNLNPQAHAILDNAENQVHDLRKKVDQIDKDRRTLDQTIATLDEKKRVEILKAHKQVNKDFGTIFGTLLKDADARLEPPAGKTALEGLEVKVAFNDKWKDSLNELSGGQRSLVALSLVLAMLKFKPAPLYILDEVDSALDLSHTQNIGTMIKNHFTTSQFIIVSLKEGMFNNANIVYKTKFVDGTSVVTRHLGKDLIKEAEKERKKKEEEEKAENEKKMKRKK